MKRADETPLQRFLHDEASSGIVLLAAAVIALAWANSPHAGSYQHLWHLPLLSQPLHFWINDGLMTVFFLVVGMEIRREMHDGALAGVRLAALPVAAALGGVAVPAMIYLACAQPAMDGAPVLGRGWAVPTATDIAFAVGMLALLGKRVPPALRVLLLAIAIIDDVIAILVIAFFYSEGVAGGGLLIAAAGVAGVLLLQRLGVRAVWAYAVPGAVIWAGLLRAGVHPTLSGVILGLMTPVVRAPTETAPPVVRVQQLFHPWVAFGIMPLFALANAGVTLGVLSLDSSASQSLLGGITAGLTLGKPLGIVLATALCVRLGWATLPEGVDMKGVLVVGCLGGIGFTMAIFICGLAFEDTLLETAKLAVLVASAAAAIMGLIAGRVLLRADQAA